MRLLESCLLRNQAMPHLCEYGFFIFLFLILLTLVVGILCVVEIRRISFYGKLMRGLVRLLWKTDGWAHATGQMASWREWDTSSSRSLDELGATLSDVSWRRLAIAPRMKKWLDKLMRLFRTSLMADGWKSGKWWLMQAKTLYNMGKIAIWHRQISPPFSFFSEKEL